MPTAVDSIAHLSDRDPVLTPPEFADVQQAANRIQGHIHRTPVLSSTLINDRVGGSLFFKCDNFQKTGAFKFRGACNTVMSLSDAELARGVVTHSSGNHAAALCYAASLRGANATVVMPSNANEVKKTAVRSYGGTIIECEPNTQAREEAMAQWVERHQMVPVVPFDDARVIAGQAPPPSSFLNKFQNWNVLLRRSVAVGCSQVR
jgi:threonine dehydratase